MREGCRVELEQARASEGQRQSARQGMSRIVFAALMINEAKDIDDTGTIKGTARNVQRSDSDSGDSLPAEVCDSVAWPAVVLWACTCTRLVCLHVTWATYHVIMMA